MKTKEELVRIRKSLLNFIDEMDEDNNLLKGNLLSNEAKELIQKDSNAFLFGLIADQSVKAELAWSLPFNLKERLNHLDIKKIVNENDIEKLEEFIKQKPALHRYPRRIAEYIFCASRQLIENYNCNAKNIWHNANANDIVHRLEQFKGISHKKASLGALLLVRDLGLDINDKENIDIAYDVHIRRIFLRTGLVEKDRQEDVLAMARKINPNFPGELTTAFWNIGRDFCRPQEPTCLICPINKQCDKKTNLKVNT